MADAAATKADILVHARARFADAGLDGVSIRDIAKHAGCTLGTVHHYFGTKDDLYAACIESVYAEIAQMREQLAQALAAGGAREKLVERAVVTAYRFAREHVVAVRLLVRAAVGAGELPPKGREQLMAFLDLASLGLASAANRLPSDLRLPLQSVVFLVARYAVQGDEELAAVAGTNKRSAQSRVERHLVDVACRLILE